MRPRKITFGDMREMVRGADYHCSHNVALSADRCSDELRLSDLEPRFTCTACRRRGADIRPDLHWNKPPTADPYSRRGPDSAGRSLPSHGTAADSVLRCADRPIV